MNPKPVPFPATPDAVQPGGVTFSVVINNYNYGRFLEAAVASVQAQLTAHDELIIVDDGSTDESDAVLAAMQKKYPALIVVRQNNQGQGAALLAGIQRARATVITFLDADDCYLPGYLGALRSLYQTRKDVDFVFCRARLSEGDEDRQSWSQPAGDKDFGLSMFLTTLTRIYLGGPNSTNSLRRRFLEPILTELRLPEWPISADDALVLGASAAGGRKYFLDFEGVFYRVHANNAWIGAAKNPAHELRLEMRRRQLMRRLNVISSDPRTTGPDFGKMILREYKTIPDPRFSDWKRYCRILRRHWHRQYFRNQLKMLGLLLKLPR